MCYTAVLWMHGYANGLVLQSQTKDVDEISSAVCYNTC